MHSNCTSSQTAIDFTETTPDPNTHPDNKSDQRRIRKAWFAMIARCYDSRDVKYYNYGGRGITVCEAWRDNINAFCLWAISNGYAPHLSLDRKDNNLGYSPDNCRWRTVTEQNNNKRTNHLVAAWGETKTMAQWLLDPRCLVSKSCLRHRIRRGVAPEDALTQGNMLVKLRKEDVLTIRECYNSGKATMNELAVKYGVCSSHICEIVNHNVWPDI